MCQYWTKAETWLVGLFSWVSAQRQKPLKEFSVCIASALARYVKHIQIRQKESLIMICICICLITYILFHFAISAGPLASRRGLLGTVSAVSAEKVLVERAFHCRAISFLCYLFQWNLKFTIFKWCVWNYMTLLCHNIIHPKNISKGISPFSPPLPPEIRALLRK